MHTAFKPRGTYAGAHALFMCRWACALQTPNAYLFWPLAAICARDMPTHVQVQMSELIVLQRIRSPILSKLLNAEGAHGVWIKT